MGADCCDDHGSHNHGPGPRAGVPAPSSVDELLTLYDLALDNKTRAVSLKGPAPSDPAVATELEKTLATINELSACLARGPFPHCPPPPQPPPPGFQNVNPQMNPMYLRIQKVKDDGNVAFNRKEYPLAVMRYSQAADFASQRLLFEHSMWAREELAVMLSNRSAAFGAMKKWAEALADAEAVIKLKRNWSKGHFRKSKTLQGMSRYEEAKDAVLLGLEFEPDNKDLLTLLDQLEEAIEPPVHLSLASSTAKLPASVFSVKSGAGNGTAPPSTTGSPSKGKAG